MASAETSLRIRPAAPEDLGPALELPNRLLADDPAWVPPVHALVARRTAAWIREDKLRLWIAERDGRVVGTISVLRDREFEADKGEKVAWFGYFDVDADEPDAAPALFAAAREVAREWGATHLRGPRDLTRFENGGLTVDGYEHLPPFLCRHHPPRYRALVEAAGFEPHHDVLAYDIPVVEADGRIRDLPDGLRTRASAVAIEGLEIRAANRWGLKADLVAAHTILNEAFRTVPDIAPMPRGMFVNVGRPYLWIADRRLLQLATVNGRPVGFAACFPELNEALREVGGRVLPLGWWRLVQGLRGVRTASFKLIGVVPELRGSGLHARLIAEIVDGVRAAGYHRLEASVIDERNGPMRAVVEGAGMTVYRRYRFYQREVG